MSTLVMEVEKTLLALVGSLLEPLVEGVDHAEHLLVVGLVLG